MYDLKISVSKILGTCTAGPPVEKGEAFYVINGDIHIPGGGSICLWALSSLLPLVPAKERKIDERKSNDWMWRVHHVQCPDPDGRVVFRIERAKKGELAGKPMKAAGEAPMDAPSPTTSAIRNLRIVVAEIKGRCTSGWKPGDHFLVRKGRLYIPAGGKVCLYALQAVLPFIAAKQRLLGEGDWLKDADLFLCPDPAGNVILRLEPLI